LARDYLKLAKAPNTRRAYRADFAHFENWCRSRGRTALLATEETLVLYFSDLASTHKVSSLARRVSPISPAHLAAGVDSPTRTPVIRTLLAGIRRVKGSAAAVKQPVLADDLRRLVQSLPTNLLGLRDRALLLLGFAGAFRRSELVSLDHSD